MLDRTVQREKGKWCDLEAQTEPEPPLHKFYIGSSVYLKYLIINGIYLLEMCCTYCFTFTLQFFSLFFLLMSIKDHGNGIHEVHQISRCLKKLMGRLSIQIRHVAATLPNSIGTFLTLVY